MAEGKIGTNLKERFKALQENRGDAVRLDEIAAVVESVVEVMKGDLVASEMVVYDELDALARYIHTARAEVAALRPDEVRDDYLPAASDELDAIVEATADATNAIMDATETLESIAAKSDVETARSN